MKPYIRIDIIREGRDPTNEFSTGTIIRATCAKEYRLNLQNPNGTAKCVRGRWKPLKPECTLVPCSIASTEHGSYVAIVVDQKDDSGKTTMQPLNAFDEIQSGEIVQFSCDEGYTVQGPSRLKCQEGSWDVNGVGLPECVPAPCSLPNIDNAVYQVMNTRSLKCFEYYLCFTMTLNSGWLSVWSYNCPRKCSIRSMRWHRSNGANE